MRLTFAFLVVIASSANLFAQSGLDFGPRSDRPIFSQLAYEQTEANQDTKQPRTVPEPDPEQEPPPPPPPRTQTVARQQDPFRSLLTNRRDYRLARTPPMFGDFNFGLGGQLLAYNGSVAISDIPLAGGNRRAQVAENNIALPVDRIYFTYNHFHNALVASDFDPTDPKLRNFSVNRYLFGIEKTFNDYQSSFELRMPLLNDFSFYTPDVGVVGGSVGNLFLNYKQLLWSNDVATVASGLGLEFPTGSSAKGYSDDASWRVNNEAYNLSPYLGFLVVPDGDRQIFSHGFLQFDIPLTGNSIDQFVNNNPMTGFRPGTLNEQALMHIDFGVGYWLFQGRTDRLVEALAALFEVHYTQALGSLDSILTSGEGGTFLDYGQIGGDAPYEIHSQRHIVNLTFGAQAQLNPNLALRFGTVVPVRNGQNRTFDAEIQASLIWYR